MACTQKALLLDKKFGTFDVGEIDVYKPGPGKLLIKVQSAGLNPVDWKIQQYGIFMQEYPAVVGTDIAGDVERSARELPTSRKAIGFRQSHFVNKFGAFQQCAIGLASTASKIPANVSYDGAATIPVALNAAYVGFYNAPPHGMGFAPPITPEARGKYAGMPIVILGGASSVGQITIQLAKLSGFSPVITIASLEHTDFLKSLGATHVVDRNLSTSETVFDSISLKETQEMAFELLAPGGVLLAVVLPPLVPVDSADGKLGDYGGAAQQAAGERCFGMIIWKFSSRLVPSSRIGLKFCLMGSLEFRMDWFAWQVSRLKLVARPQETA
ncbi:unnamed protein product [Cyclocybe aegerita]|uniref:Enoyl reductase (ER) domain-containing protein n=1 Tax=Cyclocybe aegerita TaxID=1973307 RepID=A0A8S0W009_CYCAE|nr:unnamed protein product [Cyclocybe aegerita]